VILQTPVLIEGAAGVDVFLQAGKTAQQISIQIILFMQFNCTFVTGEDNCTHKRTCQLILPVTNVQPEPLDAPQQSTNVILNR
jgi:hypothetical protein